MTTDVVVVLERLHCIREKDETPHSEPYIWPALLWVDGTTAEKPNRVGIVAPADNRARVVIKEDMRAGEAADIVSAVGVLSAPVEEGFLAMALVVALLEKDETPKVAVTAGFKAFSSELQAAADKHLEDLLNPNERDQAIQQIIRQVGKKVILAIVDKQTWGDLLIRDQDDAIGVDTMTLLRLPARGAPPTPISLGFGGGLGGQLLLYHDASQTGGGEVSNPTMIGQAGWADFKFLFAGADQAIYAVDEAGQLLLYYDASQTGGGEVSNPTMIGQAGWADFKFLFAGADQAIYAVDELRDEPNRYEIEGHLEVR
jgi:Tachylectin